MSGVRLRFAPSPTGYLHAGNARVAVLNFLFAKQKGGEFWLRLDDTDKARSEEKFAIAIEEDLAWLGIAWDKRVRQSERLSLYDKATEALRAAGRLYPCFETAEELAVARRMLLRSRRPPVYDRGSLDVEKRRRYEAEGRKAHWRFKLEHRSLVVRDLFRGESRFDFARVSDPVLLREDGQPLYTLTSVVDDGEGAISHIVRGEDHATNSAVQAQLFEALGYRVPDMAHVPLLRGASGKNEGGNKASPLSKREGSLSLRGLREGGIEPLALLSYLARLGTARTARGDEDVEQLAREFSFSDFGRASPLFDEGQLREANRRVVAKMDWQTVKARLSAEEASLLRGEDGEAFWRLFRENVENLSEVGGWLKRCFAEDGDEGRVVPSQKVQAVVGKLLDERESGKRNKDGDWVAFLASVGERTGLAGRQLYVPMRMALLGCERGPDVAGVMGLLGEERVLKRLRA